MDVKKTIYQPTGREGIRLFRRPEAPEPVVVRPSVPQSIIGDFLRSDDQALMFYPNDYGLDETDFHGSVALLRAALRERGLQDRVYAGGIYEESAELLLLRIPEDLKQAKKLIEFFRRERSDGVGPIDTSLDEMAVDSDAVDGYLKSALRQLGAEGRVLARCHGKWLEFDWILSNAEEAKRFDSRNIYCGAS